MGGAFRRTSMEVSHISCDLGTGFKGYMNQSGLLEALFAHDCSLLQTKKAEFRVWRFLKHVGTPQRSHDPALLNSVKAFLEKTGANNAKRDGHICGWMTQEF
jgi:hypothetical protein